MMVAIVICVMVLAICTLVTLLIITREHQREIDFWKGVPAKKTIKRGKK